MDVLKTIKVGVVGSRRRNTSEDYQKLLKTVEHVLLTYGEVCDIIFVSGGCKQGADNFIKEMSSELGTELIEHLPVLKDDMQYRDRVKAYYARNELIAKDSDFVIAMPHKSRLGGTESTIRYCEQLGKPVILI
jgi:hypothetical protein